MVATQLADARRLQGARVPINPRLAVANSGPTLAWYARLIGATDDTVHADLLALPGMLDHIDRSIAAGLLGGDQLNAADFQIAPSLSLLMTVDELRPPSKPDRPGASRCDSSLNIRATPPECYRASGSLKRA
jgi:hypothetical protein